MKCRICNNELYNTFYKVREMMLGTRDEFDYFQCNNCGCLQICNIPENVSQYYPKDYCDHVRSSSYIRDIISITKDKYIFSHNNSLSRFLNDHIPCKHTYMSKLLEWNDINPESWILDVGCGSGEFLKYLHRSGYKNLVGVDPFVENSCKDGVATHGCSLMDFVGYTKREFNFIILNHSFEHMPNPQEIMQCINRLLTRFGTCVIRIPTVSSKAWETYKENWVQLDAPRHFFLHSIKSMEILCQDAGLKIVDSYYDSSEFQFIGSEQYARDISLYDEKSYYVNKSEYSKDNVKLFKAFAKKYNDNRCGDQIVLRIKKLAN